MRKAGVEINNYTLTSVTTACGNPAMTKEAIQIHAFVVKSDYCLDSSVEAALINMYAIVGDLDLSETIFEEVKRLINGCDGFFLCSESEFENGLGSVL